MTGSQGRIGTVAVIGGGIQGIGVALELAARGARVVLHERTQRLHAAASLANEGKIHLGYIYANDPSLRTARQMVEGAWSFSGIVGEWLERPIGETWRSSAFDYLVHRDSLLAPADLAATYAAVAALNAAQAARPGASYFGLAADRAPEALDRATREARYGPDVIAAHATPEIAVDTEAIGLALAARVAADPRIEVRLGSEVRSVAPEGGRVLVTTCEAGVTETRAHDHAVNASWEDLQRLDATAGIAAPPGGSFRLRLILRVHGVPAGIDLPSCSVVLGPFGDLVRFGNGDLFLSWYGVGRRAMTDALRPPPDWADRPWPEEAREVRERTAAAFRELVPGLRAVPDIAIAGARVHRGVIYARGTTDIDDPHSGFHERHAIGPRSFGRYHSVDTGKYTTAPLFARRLAERLAGAPGAG